MPILVLLAAALILLVLGLLLLNSLVLAGSLLVSVGAGWLVYRQRRAARARATAAAPATEPARVEVAGPSEPAAAPTAAVTVVQHEVRAPAAEVWVIDGRPRYHRAGCEVLAGQDAEPIPHEQATEDGFIPCSLCEPAGVGAR